MSKLVETCTNWRKIIQNILAFQTCSKRIKNPILVYTYQIGLNLSNFILTCFYKFFLIKVVSKELSLIIPYKCTHIHIWCKYWVPFRMIMNLLGKLHATVAIMLVIRAKLVVKFPKNFSKFFCLNKLDDYFEA